MQFRCLAVPPGLPLKKGRCGTMTHDYKRNGTTTLFAAFNVLEGSVIGRCMQRHTHQEFIRFLNVVENQVPANKQVHVVLDNYATHKRPKVIEWLGRHDRFTFHFTPTSASWINAVEGFFAKLTNQRLKRGMFHSIVALQAAINRFVKEANQNLKSYCVINLGLRIPTLAAHLFQSNAAHRSDVMAPTVPISSRPLFR